MSLSAPLIRIYVVALLAEGVDRNSTHVCLLCFLGKSPSSRRAWIEIEGMQLQTPDGKVALLAEGVDRNTLQASTGDEELGRPPRGGRG